MNHKISNTSIFKNLSKAYINDYQSVSDLYDLNFNDDKHIDKRVSYLDLKKIDRNKLCDSLLAINSRYQAKQHALDNIEKLRDDNTLAVVTGQQAGIFTGPSYTVFKAITTIKLANQLSKSLSREIVPIFWVASEDHDFEEIRAVNYIADNKVKTIKIDKKIGFGNNNPFKTKYNFLELKESIGHIDINNSLNLAIADYIRDSSSANQEILEKILLSTLRDTESISDWFGRIMVMLLSEYGLIILDPMEKSIRELQSEFFTKCITDNDMIMEKFNEKTNILISKGYSPLISIEESATGIFTYYAGERLMVKKDRGGYYIEGSDERINFTFKEIIDLTKNDPACFSTNVILRPVVQDVTLPTIAYVAGPGELSYYGQLSGVYNVFDMKMPIIYPRENFTIVTDDVSSALDRLDITEDDFISYGLDGIKKSILEKNDDVKIDILFEEFTSKFDKEYDELLENLILISPELKEISVKNKGLIFNQFNYLSNKAHRFHRKNNRPILNELELIETNLMPKGNLQEREIPLLNYILNSEDELIKYIIEEVPMDYRHRFIRI